MTFRAVSSNCYFVFVIKNKLRRILLHVIFVFDERWQLTSIGTHRPKQSQSNFEKVNSQTVTRKKIVGDNIPMSVAEWLTKFKHNVFGQIAMNWLTWTTSSVYQPLQNVTGRRFADPENLQSVFAWFTGNVCSTRY